jgi:uncharacterized protein YkwD
VLILALACVAQVAAPDAARATAGWRDEVLALVNQDRAAAGLRPLSLSPQLTATAQSDRQYVATAGFFSHHGPNGSNPGSRIAAYHR